MAGKLPVLLVEDDQVDVMTIKRAFRDLHITNELHVCCDGEDAWEHLIGPDTPRPCIILLDVNMPRMNGIELLRLLKGHAHLRSIPVVMLTTSTEEQDKIDSFSLSVAGYMVKPVDYQQFVEVVKTIHLYWTLSEKSPEE